MNLQDLANLILVRNHLSFLINTERSIVTKDQLRPADALKAEIDRLFMEEVFDLDLEGIRNDDGVPYTIVEQPDASTIEALKAKKEAAKAQIKVENNAVTVGPPEDKPADDSQLSFDFTPKPAKPKRKSKKAAKAEDDEIANRIAEAKKEVAEKKAAGSFKRVPG
jgi:hypothetical protein